MNKEGFVIVKGVDDMKYEEVMKYVDKIWYNLNNFVVDEKTKEAFSNILDGYEQWCHL